MIAIRQGIRRYLQEPPLEKDFDIIKDPRMNKANAAFKSMLKMSPGRIRCCAT